MNTLAPRTRVGLGATSRGGLFVAIGSRRLGRDARLHVVRAAPPPPRLRARRALIDVDLDEQVLVAYEGTRPMYATLVSTGTPSHLTLLGTFRIEDKRALALMESGPGAASPYRGHVPWTMYYDGPYATHAAYWHDRFGARMSHGCINLAPLDARVLYHWTAPAVPEGWTVVKASAAVPGSIIRVRTGRVAQPALRGYARDVDRARRSGPGRGQ
ncbi:MAG: L,D-transpeptidase [Myxococcota bacterium]